MTRSAASSPLELISLLSLCPLFAEVNPDEDLASAADLELLRLERGDVLMRLGEVADSMFAVVSGRLHVFLPKDNLNLRFATTLGPAQTIGEAGMLHPGPRMATVLASRDCEVLKIGRHAFDTLTAKYPAIVTRLARSLAHQVRLGTEVAPGPPLVKTIAVISAGGAGPATAFTRALLEALRAFGSVLHLNRERFETLFGATRTSDVVDTPVPAATVGLVRWLTSLEAAHRFVVWEADNSPTPWTSLCLRQADRVIAVGQGEASPDLNEVERSLLFTSSGHAASVELVLLHREIQDVYVGTEKWLSARQTRRHHHLREGRSADVSRVARSLAGRAVGLTLGGGGARGMAHIGVIRALEEAHIPIDMIGGVSMGAIIAGLYARGCNWQTMLRLVEDGMVNGGLRTDFTLPLFSITSGRRFERSMKKFFGDVAVEDLWLNYFCVSCNLSLSELKIHRSGPLWKSVVASNAIPGILPPVVDGGHLLVDGGVLNNQPGDIMKEMCGGPAIVCNVSPRVGMTVDAAITRMPSPWQALWSRFSPTRARVHAPNISTTMMRTLLVASNKKSQEVERDADFYLRPPIDQFRLDDWSRSSEIVEAGYRYAQAELGKWREAGRLSALK